MFFYFERNINNPPLVECRESNQTWALDLFEDDANITWSIPENITRNNTEFNIDCELLDIKPLFRIKKEHVYFESGSLVLRNQPGVKYQEFCLDKTWKGFTLAMICPCFKGGICVNFCCQDDELLAATHDTLIGKCVKTENITQLTSTWKVNVSEQLFSIKRSSLPKCSAESNNTMEILNAENKKIQYEFEVLANGTLFMYNNYSRKSKEWKDPKDYCVAMFQQSNESKPSMNILYCNKDQAQIRRRAAIYVTLFVIGAVFLVATLVVHILVPNMRRSIRGLSLVAHCACMLAAHITLAVAQLIAANVTDVPCQIIAYLCQFTLLGGFFWLNVMCLDIGNTFRSLKSMARCLNLDYSVELRKFQWYCIYAFGVPFILMVVTMGVDHSGLDYRSTFKPNFGLTTCWFEKESAAIVLFFFGPVGLLLLINLFLYLHVSCKIASEDAQLRNVSSNSNRRRRKSVILFVKLSALMGLPWIMEIVSWAVGGEDHYWYFTDAINMLRSVFIFIVFCCKPKVWEMLKKNSRMSSSIRWFSRRVGRKTMTCPASKENQHEVTQSTNVSAENDGKIILQLQENGDRKTEINSQGIANSAFDAKEMQDRKTN